MDPSSGSGEWWESLYDEVLAEAFLVRIDQEDLAATLNFLTEKLALEPGSTIFDQC